jgi:hypothetical protein
MFQQSALQTVSFHHSKPEWRCGRARRVTYQESSFCTLNITMMKKTTYQLALVVLLNLLWLGTACERQDPEPTPQDGAKPALWTYDNPANSANPYDYAGVEHNRGLEHLGTLAPQIVNLAVTNNDAAGTKNFVRDRLNMFYNSSGGGANMPITAYNFNEASQPSFQDAITGLGLSSAATGHALNLVNSLTALDQGQEANIEPAVNMIMQHESAILADMTLAPSDRMMLLGGASVLRHSAWFWIQLVYPHHFGHPWFWILGHWGWNPYWNPYPFPYYWHKAWCIAYWDYIGFLYGYRLCGFPCAIRMSAYYSALASMYYCWWWW